MIFVNSAYYAPTVTLKCDFEKTEIESFCKLIPLRNDEALSAIKNLKKFLDTEEYLCFEKLAGGDCNAPILISKLNLLKTPVGVLKHESNNSAELRLKALDEMRNDGFDMLPSILQDTKGNYLVQLGERSFSCIEYLKPDLDQSSSLEQMFKLA